MDRHKLARVALRRMISPTLRDILRSRGLLEDVSQSIEIAVFLYHGQSDVAFMNAVQREVYRTLRDAGFRRGRQSSVYIDPILPFSIAIHSNLLVEFEREGLLEQLRD